MAAAARSEFGVPMRWVEARSRDTRENAGNSVPMLAAAGVHEILVVTSGWHMPRALRSFAPRRPPLPAASGASGNVAPLRIRGAPMGLAYPDDTRLLAWMPSGEGAQRMRAVLREVFASFVSAPVIPSPGRAAPAEGASQ